MERTGKPRFVLVATRQDMMREEVGASPARIVATAVVLTSAACCFEPHAVALAQTKTVDSSLGQFECVVIYGIFGRRWQCAVKRHRARGTFLEMPHKCLGDFT
jgi:hypothetical protein